MLFPSTHPPQLHVFLLFQSDSTVHDRLVSIMASGLQTDTDLGVGAKKGLYRELRQNPYLFGLSAVSI